MIETWRTNIINGVCIVFYMQCPSLGYSKLYLLVCVADVCQSPKCVNHVGNKFYALRIKRYAK